MMRPKLTAIGSGKGGTGKTLVATALAATLARQGERVLLCDADLGLSNTTVHLGLESGGDLAGLLGDRLALDQAVVSVPAGEGNSFELVSAPPGSGSLANLDRAVVERLIGKLRLASAYDRVLLDLGAGVDTATMEFAARSDDALLVLTADPAALTDAYAFVKLLLRNPARESARPPLALVNMADNEVDAARTRDALAKTCRAFLKTAPDYVGFVPRDQHVQYAVRQQRPLVASYPKAPSTRAFEEIARKLGDNGVRGLKFEDALPLR